MEQVIPNISIPTIVLSTALSLLGAIIGGCIAGMFSLRSKDKEYKNEYYKMVLEKRMKAYEVLNEVNGTIKFRRKNKKGESYHSCFTDGKSLIEAKEILNKIPENDLWLSKKAMRKMIRLQSFFFRALKCKSDEELMSFGIVNYEKITNINEEINNIIREDILSLHKINKFLKRGNEYSFCVKSHKNWIKLKFKIKRKFFKRKRSRC